MKLILTALFALTTIALADTATFEQVLSGKDFPLTYKLKDLDANWRRFTASTGVDAANPLNAVRAMYGSTSANYYYTKGQTVAIGGESYLVAYRWQSKALDMAAMQVAMRGGQPPELEKPTATTTLALALLNLRSAGSLGDIRPFNLEAELGGGEAAAGGDDDKQAQATNEASLKNLRQIGVALLTYISERKVIPTLTDTKTAREELVLYLRNKDVLNLPGTQKPYAVNPSLTGRKPSEFDKEDKVVVFYEPTVGADGTRGVLFLDGHADRIAEQQWKKLKEISQISQ